jgi:hypothetical protein
MKYLNSIEPDELMKKLVARFCREIRVGSIYFLMARYSKKTCDKAWMKNSNYICMNIRGNGCIYVVDLYPANDRQLNSIVFSVFKRSENCLYRMSDEDENDKEGNVVKRLEQKGFCINRECNNRYESTMIIDAENESGIEQISAKLKSIVECLVGMN